MRGLLAALCAALMLGCGAASSGAGAGLRGLVMRGPVTPVCRVGVPCFKPAAQVTIMFSRGGRSAATTRTDATGHYRVALPAGTYAVRTPRRTGIAIRPAQALVRADVMRRVDLTIDTGIR